MKSAAAMAATPMMPTGLANALPVSAAQYAKAIEVANKWAYTTAYYLKITLKVDDAASEAVLEQLQIDGILGPKGSSGLCLASRFNTLESGSVAKGISRISKPAPQKKTRLEMAKSDLSDDEPEETLNDDPPEDPVIDQEITDQTEVSLDETPELP